MSYYDLLNYFNEADSDEEKDKNKEDKDDDKKKEKEDDDKKKEDKKADSDEKDETDDTTSDEPDMDEYNDLIGDDDVTEDDSDSSSDDLDDELGDLNSDDDDMDSDNDNAGSEYNTLIVMNKSDGDSESGSFYDKAAKVGYAYTVIANNMKHIHLTACGDKFREIHDKTENLYHHFNYAADYYFETALQSPLTKLDNPTRAKEHCEDIPVEQCSDYEFELAMETISSNLQLAITYIEDLRKESGSRTDIQSRADEELSFLRKEKDFIIRRSCHKSTPCSPMDSAMESYNWLF